jgi:hypothetical protein
MSQKMINIDSIMEEINDIREAYECGIIHGFKFDKDAKKIVCAMQIMGKNIFDWRTHDFGEFLAPYWYALKDRQDATDIMAFLLGGKSIG